jgi:PAS domain S-box-containing protein
MDIKIFEQKIEAAQARLEDCLQRVEQVASPSDLLLETTAEMSVGLEELQVTIEELYMQQEQLQAANQATTAERERYLELFEYALDGYLITNAWGIIQQVNQTAAKMLNRRQDFLVGKPMSIFIPQLERRTFYNLLHLLREAEPIQGMEIRIEPYSDRPTFTATISIATVRDRENKIVGFRWLLRDVTELKKAQIESQRQQRRSQLLAEVNLKIRQSARLEEILQTAVNESQKLLQTERVLIFRLEPDNCVQVLAEAGLTSSTCFVGQNLSCNFLPAEYRTQSSAQNSFGISQIIPQYYFETDTNQTQSTKTTPQTQLSNLVAPIYVRQQLWGFLAFHKCPTESPTSATSSVTRQWEDFEIDIAKQLADQIGIAVTQAQFISNMQELVARRTKELRNRNHQLNQEIAERLQLETILRHSKNGVYLIADSLPILISYVNNQQHFEFCNKAYEAWFGMPVTKIYQSHLKTVIGKSLYQQIEDKIEAVLSGKNVVFELQIPYQNKDLRWVNVSFTPHLNGQKNVLGFFGLIEDISERKEIEAMKDEFISVVSHELRTPLTSIHGSLRLLNAGRFDSSGEKGQQLIGMAEKNTERLVRLVNDILSIQRLDSGKITLEREPCNLADLIATALETMKQLAQQQKIELEYIPVSISAIVDSDSILQVLTNLLSNAIKFSPEHSKVTIKAEELPHEILVQVSDRGRGIPPNKLETIFERFQQVDVSDSRQKQGSGLGLSICQQIVELHQGKIWAESILNEGSTFFFTLPKQF